MSAKTNHKHTTMPPADLEEMGDLSLFLEGLTEPAALLGPDGQTVPLPIEAFDVLREVVEAMRSGKAITVAPIDQMLTTQEAANFLGISRPTLVKLLEKEELAFERTAGGRHRKIRLEDVINYQKDKRKSRRRILDQLTSEAYSAGLYEDSADSVSEASRAVRKEPKNRNR